MALNRDQKTERIQKIVDLLENSKMTVVAEYNGVTVKSIQKLRRAAQENGTIIVVAKNRLVKQAMKSLDSHKDTEADFLKNQVLYAFNSNDEVAAAQVMAKYAREESNLKFVGGIGADGKVLNAADITTLASMPSKDVLRAQLLGTISAPMSSLVSLLQGNQRGLLYALKAKHNI